MNKTLLASTVALGGGALLVWRCLPPIPFSTQEIREYESVVTWEAIGEASKDNIPHRTGKVVIIKPSSWQVYGLGTLRRPQIGLAQAQKMEKEIDPPVLDDSWWLLDPSVRANSPNEVSTVILCDYRNLPVAEYKGTANFYGNYPSSRKGVYLNVYDWKRQSFMGRCLLAEDDPKLNEIAAGRFTGKASEIADFVARMPLRN